MNKEAGETHTMEYYPTVKTSEGAVLSVSTQMDLAPGNLEHKWRRTKEPPDEVQEDSEKVDLKLNIHKTKIMTSGPITSWQIDGETMETMTDFISLPPKSQQMVTAAMKLKDAYSLEGKLWPT